ncbi:MAG: hypothetical protein JNK23_14420 [Opitutaceae bacterium]|nr:hypothetical protein [Opitutaceae bacterium]
MSVAPQGALGVVVRWSRMAALWAWLALWVCALPAAEVAEQIFSQRLQTLLDAAQWSDASRHIQQAQALRPVPQWLPGREAEVRLAQVRIAAGRGDVLAALAAARLFLSGETERAPQLLALARALHAAEEKTVALALVKEIVRREPDFPPAIRQLAEWEPPVEPKALPPAPKPPVETQRRAEPKAPAAEPDEEAALLARLRTAHEQGNVPALLAAARLFLTGERARSLRLLEIAREMAARGDRATAITLTKEVLRRTADFPPAKRQLAELEAAASK